MGTIRAAIVLVLALFLLGRAPVFGQEESSKKTFEISPNAELWEKIQQVTKGDQKLTIRLTIEEVTPPKDQSIALRVFLNKTTADGKTGLNDLHYAGSFTFFPASRDKQTETVFMDLSPTLRRLSRQEKLRVGTPLQITLVSVSISPQNEGNPVKIQVKKVVLSVHE